MSDFYRQLGIAPELAAGMRASLASQIENNAWDFFVYGSTFVNIGVSATVTQDIAIQADSTFLAMAGVLAATTTAAPAVIIDPAPFTCTLFDTGSGRALFDRAQHVNNVFGTGRRPAVWMYYRRFKPNSTVRVTLTNLDAANAMDVFVGMVGVKVFNTNMGEGR